MDIQSYKGVFVFVQMQDGKVSDVALELLGKAQDLAKSRQSQVTAVVLGSGDERPYEQLAQHGAQNIVAVWHPLLAQYNTLGYTYALEKIVQETKPESFLFGATPIGRDLAPRLSARLGTGLTADCTSLEVDEETGNLIMTRPAFGGNLMANILCDAHRPQMATVRPGVMQKATLDSTAKANITEMTVDVPKECAAIEVLETVMKPRPKMDIKDAKVLVSGGRGLANPANFAMLESVAEVMGGTVAASRAAVDAGWVPKNIQVGQTGQTVRPDLYIACGISGAIQHAAGMEESGIIIAINKDEKAPIFALADLGIVGDAMGILPALEKELREEML